MKVFIVGIAGGVGSRPARLPTAATDLDRTILRPAALTEDARAPAGSASPPP